LSSTRRLKALIFDFDGLIVDSESPGYQAWSELYAAHGCRLPFEKYAQCIGTFEGFDLFRYLEAQAGRPIDKADVLARCSTRWNQLMEQQPLLPGIEDCVTSAKQLGLALAVASSSTSEWVAGNLGRLGLVDCFDAICCREHVASVKPDPALYLLALEKLGVHASEAIAFEDSPNGILAAKRAGIFCVAIPNPLTRQLVLDQADRRLNSLSEFKLEDAFLD
jgi:beta-phosphoglucomutase-like phosphatase (HAD superfamily)